MMKKARHFGGKNRRNEYPLYSYVDVFNDGKDKLHPAFHVNGVLLVLTHTCPRQTPGVKLKAQQVLSRHFKAKSSEIYVTLAYNQGAQRYNNVAGGKLRLLPDDVTRLAETFKLGET